MMMWNFPFSKFMVGVHVKTWQQIFLHLSKHVSMGVFTKNLNPEDALTIDIPELVRLITVKFETVHYYRVRITVA